MSDPVAPRPLLLGLGWPPDQIGGLNRYLRDLYTALGDARAVVVGPARDAPSGVVVVSTHRAPLLARLRAFDRAARREATAVDVVDAHFALYAALPVHRGPLRAVPLVVHFHGPWAAEAAAGRARSGIRRRRAVRRMVERSVYRRAARIVTLSGAFARILVQDYGVSPWRLRILSPGVAPCRATDADADRLLDELGLASDRQLVVSVRRLVPRTGVGVLLDAWQGVERDGDSVLVVVGDGPERAHLERRAAALALRNVHFVGAVDDERLAALYRAATLSVVPSTELEGYGLVVLESLAAGTPAIVTDTGGLPETVVGLGSGLVVPAGDVAALHTRITTALNGSDPLPDPAHCRAHAQRADWAAVAARHRDVYAEACRPSTRMRVLFIDHCARLSGGEIAMLRLVSELRDVERHVITFEDGPLLPALGAAAVTNEVLPLAPRTADISREDLRRRIPWVALFDAARHTLRLAHRLLRLRPEVVCANSLKACLITGVAARVAHVPCVWHVRDILDDDAYGASAARIVRALARRLPTAVVANSDSTLAALRLPTVGAPMRMVIPDPLPDAFFAATPHERAPGVDPVIGIVGRLAPWKGQHVFLDAFGRAFPRGGARAVIVGDALFGEDDYRDALYEQAARLGIADRVEFRGFRHDVPAELRRLDVLVHATTTAEPFGQVVVEGMATGLPVIATDAGGPAEILTNGRDGLLVPPGDVAALARALGDLAGDGERCAALGLAARETAERYRGPRVAARFEQLLADVAARR